MSERREEKSERRLIIHHRGRGAQTLIYLGKFLRMFIYQNDWKVLPMAALIAGLVGIVIRKRLFITMEGSLMGAFAMVMVAIWNGCFNSIQVICRERDVIKREHRAGMHITSYVFAHMIYQAMLCLLQTGVTMYVTRMVGVQYPMNGLVTPFMIVDMGVSVFLISFAADMLSLWVSCLARSTTTAMTIMPFVLIFQLVFSGGMMSLPEWTESLTPLTISNPALKLLASQADYNSRPVMTIWNQLNGMRDREINATISLGQVLDLTQKKDNEAVAQVRDKTLEQLIPIDKGTETLLGMRLGVKDEDGKLTLGEIFDALAVNPEIQPYRDRSYSMRMKLGSLIELIGEERVADILQNKVSEASYNPDYAFNRNHITGHWLILLNFVFVFAILSVITLEFIDKDKR